MYVSIFTYELWKSVYLQVKTKVSIRNLSLPISVYDLCMHILTPYTSFVKWNKIGLHVHFVIVSDWEQKFHDLFAPWSGSAWQQVAVTIFCNKIFYHYFQNCILMFFRSQVNSSQVGTWKCWPAISQQPVCTQDALTGTRFQAKDGANFTAAGEEFSCCCANTRCEPYLLPDMIHVCCQICSSVITDKT